MPFCKTVTPMQCWVFQRDLKTGGKNLNLLVPFLGWCSAAKTAFQAPQLVKPRLEQALSCRNTEGAQPCRSGFAMAYGTGECKVVCIDVKGFCKVLHCARSERSTSLDSRCLSARVLCCGGFSSKAVVLFENIQKQCFLSHLSLCCQNSWLVGVLGYQWSNWHSLWIHLVSQMLLTSVPLSLWKDWACKYIFQFRFPAFKTPSHLHCFGISVWEKQTATPPF